MVERSSHKFWNDDEIGGYDDSKEVVMSVNSLSKSGLMGTCDRIHLVLKNHDFTYSPFVWLAFLGFQTTRSFMFSFLFFFSFVFGDQRT